MEAKELFGTGWSFPPKFDHLTLSPVMEEGEAAVDQSIRIILSTRLGERILRNEYGSSINDLLFEPLNANMHTHMASSLKESLLRNEPRIDIRSIALTQPDPMIGRIDIHIGYTLIETQTDRNLVVPFYIPDNLNS